MAFTIKIFEKDDYIFSLLKTRLSNMFPDAYIINAIESPGQSDCVNFSEFTKIIYDPRNIDMSDFKDAISIYDNCGVIDCRKIAEELGVNPALRKTSNLAGVGRGLSIALLPFVYVEDREALIGQMVSDGVFNSDHIIRLDFMGKMRVPGPESSGIISGGMTGLLAQAAKKSFKPEDILSYCNMDKTGFLTPGATTGEDDVYDAGFYVVKKLTDASVSLAKESAPEMSVLDIYEGFRTSDLIELTSSFDEVALLLPSRIGQENLGIKGLASGIERKLVSGRLSIRYAEDMHSLREDDVYEQAL